MTDDTKETEAKTEAPVKKELSMEQFKAWLEGVEEMQEDGWHPSASQWLTIRAKFDLIIEPKAPAPVAPANVAAGPMPMPLQPPPAYREREWHNPPPMPETEISPAAKAIMTGTKPQDVDSADGNYDSSFG